MAQNTTKAFDIIPTHPSTLSIANTYSSCSQAYSSPQVCNHKYIQLIAEKVGLLDPSLRYVFCAGVVARRDMPRVSAGSNLIRIKLVHFQMGTLEVLVLMVSISQNPRKSECL